MSNGESPAHRAAMRLLEEKETLARAVTAKLYDESPDLMDRHGERGRVKTLQDMHYNIEHLIPAVDLENTDMWVSYVQWLDDMLRARGVRTRDVTRCLELLADETKARFAADEAAPVLEMLSAGVASLATPA